ncbi:hypothetical protein Plhal703r1_c07g0037451 [Plasmopara halstedii]
MSHGKKRNAEWRNRDRYIAYGKVGGYPKRWIFCKKWPKAWWSYLNVPSCENCSRDKNLLLCVGVLQKLLRLIQSIEQEIDPDDSVTTAPVVPTALGCYHY